jgi:hypothetical protein
MENDPDLGIEQRNRCDGMQWFSEHNTGQEAIRCMTPLPGLHDRRKVWQVEQKLEAGVRSLEHRRSEIGG